MFRDAGHFEQGVTVLIGVTAAAIYAFMFIAVYGYALANDHIVWDENTTDVSISQAMASLGSNAPFISVVAIYLSLIFVLISLRQNLMFPVLPFLYCFGTLFFCLLPIITVEVSKPLHFVCTCIYLLTFSIGVAMTTREYGKNKGKPWMAMTVISLICMFATVGLGATSIYGLLPDADLDVNTKLFTVAEFFFGAAFLAWVVVVSIPSASFIKERR
jgi:hypothetical protein